MDDHRHCKVCGLVCPPDEETCSAACRTKREATMKSRRLWTGILYVLIVFFAAILLLQLLR